MMKDILEDNTTWLNQASKLFPTISIYTEYDGIQQFFDNLTEAFQAIPDYSPNVKLVLKR
jgi:hypothetical protein